MLEGYPRTFYSEIIDKMDNRLLAHYEEHAGEKYYHEPFHDFAMSIIHDSLTGKSGEHELRYFANEKQKYYRKKKKRWYEYLSRDVNQLSVSEKMHPFYFLGQQKEILTRAQWRTLYGSDSIETIVKREVDRAKEWMEDPDSILIEFPAFDSMTEKRRMQAFVDDIIIAMLNVLNKDYGYRIDNIVRPYVDDMTSGSIFSDTRMSYTNPNAKEDFETELFRSEDGLENLILTIDKGAFVEGKAVRHLDVKDQETLLYLIKKVEMGNIDPTSTFVIDIGEYAKLFSNGRPSGKLYDATRERFFRLSNITYQKFRDGKQIAGIHFLDATEVPDNHNMLNITLGPAISTPLINNKIRHFSGQEYDKLELNLSRILFLHLQRERLKAYKRFSSHETDECATTFSYSNFQAMAYLHGGKRKNWNSIKESLAEMQERHVMVKEYEVDNISYTVRVIFYPLTNEELRDAKWYGIDDLAMLTVNDG